MNAFESSASFLLVNKIADFFRYPDDHLIVRQDSLNY